LSHPVTVLYFAWLRERVGVSHEAFDLPDTVRTVGDLLNYLPSRSPGHAAALQTRRSVRCSVNQEFADPTTPVSPGDEIGLFPPVTGG
jgi:molybdopterin converting factor subunit 1